MRKLLLLLLIGSYSLMYSQNKVSGYVIDENDQPVIGAVAVCLDQKNNTILHSVMADTAGYFSFENVQWDTQKIKITGFGYKENEILSNEEGNTLKIVLYPLSETLREVVVSARSSVVQKNDRLVFNVSNSNLTKGNSTFELLKFTPLVTVAEDRITMLGRKSIILYVNGRKTNLPQDQALGYLKSLPAENISSIEIITSPDVTFRTNGTEGVINLVLKKNEADGLKGTLSVSSTQRHYNSQDGGLYIDYQKNKLNLSGNVYASNDENYFINNTTYYYFNSGNKNTFLNREKPIRRYIGGSVRADYHLSDKHIIGLLINSSYNKHKDNRLGKTLYEQITAGVVDSATVSRNNIDEPTFRLSANANYRFKTDNKGSQLSVDVDYFRNNKDNTMLNSFFYEQNNTTGDPYSRFRQRSDDHLDNYSGKVEYTHVFDQMNKLTTGLESYYTDSKSDFFYGNWLNGDYVSDPQRSNTFDYNETYAAAYASYNRIFSPKLITVVGLKAEYGKSKGKQKATSENIDRENIYVLPSLSVLYTINPDNRLAYNFTSYIGRPGYYSLNPFRFYLSPTTYKEYNPNLEDIDIYINTLSYTLKSKYIFNLNYMYSPNATNNFLVPVDDKYTKYINANFGKLHSVWLTLVWNDSFLDDRVYFNSSLTGTYFRSKGSVENIVVNVTDFNFNLDLSLGWQISKKHNWNITSRYVYRSKSRLAHENNDAFNSLDISLKKVFSNNMSLNFGINGLIRNSTYNRQKTTDNYKYYYHDKTNWRSFFVKFSIPFGNTKSKGAQYRRTSSGTTESRMKE